MKKNLLTVIVIFGLMMGLTACQNISKLTETEQETTVSKKEALVDDIYNKSKNIIKDNANLSKEAENKLDKTYDNAKDIVKDISELIK